ncbi:MAG: 2-phospho-L-lactate guanylyltransferase [Pseudomonadales bacterium]|nr:2-phospho-L-lactate guanylyltransferase [Pseudomonadales bacterium]
MTRPLTWAVVPVKSLTDAKSRLADVLNDRARQHLVLAMLEDLLAVLHKISAIDQVLIVTNDARSMELAQRYNALILPEPTSAGLNLAVLHAANYLDEHQVARMLVLPADIPFAQADEIRELVSESDTQPNQASSVTLVSDQAGVGTNAMMLTPPDGMTPMYGENSFKRHTEYASELGLNPVLASVPSVGLDIDTPDDLLSLLVGRERLAEQSCTRAWVDEHFDYLTAKLAYKSPSTRPNESLKESKNQSVSKHTIRREHAL